METLYQGPGITAEVTIEADDEHDQLDNEEIIKAMNRLKNHKGGEDCKQPGAMEELC